MRAVGALLRGLFLTNMRNRQGLFWSLFFPVLLMVVFGLLGNSGPSRVRLAISGPPGAQTSEIAAYFRRLPLFTVSSMSQSEATSQLRQGHEDASLQILPNAGPRLQIRLQYNGSNPLNAGQSVAAVSSALAELNMELTHAPSLIHLQTQPLRGAAPSSYLDFLLPGILSLMAMQGALFGIGTGLTRWKEKGILRRFRVTPLSPAQFLGSTVLNYLIFNLATSVIVVAFATAVLHASVKLPVISLAIYLILGIAVFIAMGFAIAGRSKSQEATIPIINLVSFPMMFLSGIFFPVASLPKVLHNIVQLFPLTFLVDAVRGLMSGQYVGFGGHLPIDLLGLVLWLLVMGALAARTWSWD